MPDEDDKMKADFEKMKEALQLDIDMVRHQIDVMSASVPDPQTMSRSEVAALLVSNQFLGMAGMIDLILTERVTPDMFKFVAFQSKAMAAALITGMK